MMMGSGFIKDAYVTNRNNRAMIGNRSSNDVFNSFDHKAYGVSKSPSIPEYKTASEAFLENVKERTQIEAKEQKRKMLFLLGVLSVVIGTAMIFLLNYKF